MTNDVRIHVDDLIPRLQDAGIIENLENYASFNRPQLLFESWCITQVLSPTIEQVCELLRDWKVSGHDTMIEIDGIDLSGGIVRPDVPSGLGTNGVNIWFTPPNPLIGIWRVYVNGVLKKVQINDNYTSVSEIGARPGDIVQICRVVDGIVGWWGRVQL